MLELLIIPIGSRILDTRPDECSYSEDSSKDDRLFGYTLDSIIYSGFSIVPDRYSR